MNSQDSPKRLHKNVILMGITSFFTDVSSEMIYPLVQAFVSLVLASAGALIAPVLGIIEGIAEATASLLKIYSGHISDRVGRRKPLTIAGYALSGASKLLYFLAPLGWTFILFSRFSDRVGKGLRTAPRDALIAESIGPGSQGRAFGFHRAMDFTGALLGVAICYFISLRYLDPATRTITSYSAFYSLFLISLVPAALGVMVLFFVSETRPDHAAASRPALKFAFKGLDSRLKVFFLAVFLFTLGNSSNQFLLLKSMDSGVSLPDVLLMYMAFNLTTAVLSTPLGGLSDRIGRKKVILTGYGLYSFVYVMFGFIGGANNSLLWGFWIIYGAYYALTEGIEKALVSDLAPAEKKATVMGMFSTVTGVTLLPASLIAGLLYSFAGHSAPFIFGGAMASLSLGVILF
ncbi:MAG TPA: MFS transporter, partial [Spirochaetes bacterium]|nr:MFS transporter [Spirochaetota bacterium]